MAHLLEVDENGHASLAYHGEKPWMGLGTEVPNDVSVEEMMKAANLDWTVSTVPLYGKVGNELIQANHAFLIRDTDKSILDEVTLDWKPVQNFEAFDFFKKFVEAGHMEMNTAGALKDGQIVWALAKVKESFTVFKDDVIDSYLLFSLPHKFGQSIDIRFTPVRVVCNNTLSLALESSHNGRVRVTHRTEFNPERVKEMLGIAHSKMEVYKDAAEMLGKKHYTKKALVDYASALFPLTSQSESSTKELSRSASQIISLVDIQPGADFARGSWWNCFNAVTFYVDHIHGRNDNNRLMSAWYGQGQKIKNEALKLALKFCA